MTTNSTVDIPTLHSEEVVIPIKQTKLISNWTKNVFMLYQRDPGPCGQPMSIPLAHCHHSVMHFFDKLAHKKIAAEIKKTLRFISQKRPLVVPNTYNTTTTTTPTTSINKNVTTNGLNTPPYDPSKKIQSILQALLKTWICLAVMEPPVALLQYYKNRFGPTSRLKIVWSLPFPSNETNRHVCAPHILDIGCGVGRDILNYTDLQPHSVTFIDISSEMLAEAERKWRRFGFNNYLAAFVPTDISQYIPKPSTLRYYRVHKYATHEILLQERQSQQCSYFQFLDDNVKLPHSSLLQPTIRRGGNIVWQCNDTESANGLTATVPTHFYDYIFCHYVLQHCLTNDALKSTLTHIANVLSPNGKLACIIPNANVIQAILHNKCQPASTLSCRIWAQSQSDVSQPFIYNFQAKPEGTIYKERLIPVTLLTQYAQDAGLKVIQQMSLTECVHSSFLTSNIYWKHILTSETSFYQVPLSSFISTPLVHHDNGYQVNYLFDLFTLFIMEHA